jgi:hypothetical protein
MAEEDMESLMDRHQKLVAQLVEIDPYADSVDGEDVHVVYMRMIMRDLNECCKQVFPDHHLEPFELHPLAVRFNDYHKDYLIKGSLENTKYWLNHDDSVSIEEYMPMRLYDSGIYQCEVLIELTVGVCLTRKQLQEPDMYNINLIHNRLVSVLNDLVSYEKEVVATSNPSNAVQVAMRHNQVDFSQAVDILVDICHKDWEQMCEIVDRRKGTWGSENLEKYVELMKETGLYACVWHFYSLRYFSTTSPFADFRLK